MTEQEFVVARARVSRDDRRWTAEQEGTVAMTAALAPSGAVAPRVAATGAESEEEVLDLPILRAASKVGDVVIVGGLSEPEPLDSLRTVTGIELDQIGVDPDGAVHAITKLSKRVRSERVSALVLLDGLLDGIDVAPLATAANEVHLAVAFAGLGDTSALRRALIELDLHAAGERMS